MKTILTRLRTGTWSAVLVLSLAGVACGAQSIAPVIEISNPLNAAAQQSKPYIVLVSLDGFRYDYAQKYGARNLLALAKRGASAPNGMAPSYPSVTFPNHYSIVTGLYPEHHGIVANSFYDPERKESYDFGNAKAVRDGSWYGGTPLWVLAEKQGMRAACLFWPGSEAEIQGKRPSYYVAYDDKFPDDKRVAQVLVWLRLPPERRPHFITLYYSEPDHAGHAYGPESPETAAAVRHVDDMIGKLADGIAATGLMVDLIVVADHGMETVQGNGETLDRWADLSNVKTSGSLLYAQSGADAQKVYASLLGKSDAFKVYRRADVPKHLHYNANPRAGDPVIVPTGPYVILAHDPRPNRNVTLPRGNHGYDPQQMLSMKAIFYAAGPDIRAGVTVAPFENVDLYPFVARILGLRIGPIDGNLKALDNVLRSSSRNSVN